MFELYVICAIAFGIWLYKDAQEDNMFEQAKKEPWIIGLFALLVVAWPIPLGVILYDVIERKIKGN